MAEPATAQTKPVPSKPGSAKQAAAKPATKPAAGVKKSTPSAAKTSSGSTQKGVSKPVSKPAVSPTSGQTSTSKPAPTVRPTGTTPTTSTPTKTATSPTGQYNAKNNTAASKPISKPQPVYGPGFSRNDKLLNVGLGLSSYYYGTPIGVSFEGGVHRDISVGAQLDYNSGRYNDYYYNSSRWGYKAYYLGVRGSYHFNRLLRIRTSKVDLYAGVGLGYKSFRWNDRSYGYGYDYRSGLFANYFVGGKFYFVPKVAAFAELGYTGLSSSRVGIAFKF